MHWPCAHSKGKQLVKGAVMWVRLSLPPSWRPVHLSTLGVYTHHSVISLAEEKPRKEVKAVEVMCRGKGRDVVPNEPHPCVSETVLSPPTSALTRLRKVPAVNLGAL